MSESVKQRAQETIARLPESATWDDIRYELQVREAIDAGLRDLDSDRVLTSPQVREFVARRLQSGT